MVVWGEGGEVDSGEGAAAILLPVTVYTPEWFRMLRLAKKPRNRTPEYRVCFNTRPRSGAGGLEWQSRRLSIPPCALDNAVTCYISAALVTLDCITLTASGVSWGWGSWWCCSPHPKLKKKHFRTPFFTTVITKISFVPTVSQRKKLCNNSVNTKS